MQPRHTPGSAPVRRVRWCQLLTLRSLTFRDDIIEQQFQQYLARLNCNVSAAVSVLWAGYTGAVLVLVFRQYRLVVGMGPDTPVATLVYNLPWADRMFIAATCMSCVYRLLVALVWVLARRNAEAVQRAVESVRLLEVGHTLYMLLLPQICGYHLPCFLAHGVLIQAVSWSLIVAPVVQPVLFHRHWRLAAVEFTLTAASFLSHGSICLLQSDAETIRDVPPLQLDSTCNAHPGPPSSASTPYFCHLLQTTPSNCMSLPMAISNMASAVNLLLVTAATPVSEIAALAPDKSCRVVLTILSLLATGCVAILLYQREFKLRCVFWRTRNPALRVCWTQEQLHWLLLRQQVLLLWLACTGVWVLLN